MSYEWSEKRFRDGGVEWKLLCPLTRGEHRPVVATSASGHWVYATAISGYSRRFNSILEAKAWVEASVPAEVGGFIRKGATR